MKSFARACFAVVASVFALVATTAHAQFVSGTIFGTGLGSNPGGRDSNWNVVAVPSGFTPPSSQTTPYDPYVPYSTVTAFYGGSTIGGGPQQGLVYLGGTNYWIAPQTTTASLVGGLYNWVAQQQFYVPVAGFYRFDFPGAGDNELEFYIDGSLNTTDPKRPTITGGQQIGGRAGTFTSITTFTGGAQLSAGTHTASMVLWDYGGETGALIGSSTFAPAVAYWAPGSGAGGNGTWTNTNAYWTTDSAGLTTKQPWTSGVGVAYFGGTSGTVSVGENVSVNQIYFTSPNYVVQGGAGAISYGNGGTITTYSGTATIAAAQSFSNGLKIAGNGTTVLSGTTTLSGAQVVLVDSSNLLVNGAVNSPGANGSVYVSAGNLGGIGSIYGRIAGSGMVNPGLTGTASGILTAEQFIATDGLDASFLFSGTVPNYASASNSTNDLVRLTGDPRFTAPFPSALSSANTLNVFFADLDAAGVETFLSEAGLGTKYSGAFFTNADGSFLPSVASARYGFFFLGDGQGTAATHNGQGYYGLRDIDPNWTRTFALGTEAVTANFAGGNELGQVMTFTVAVPEPSTGTAIGLAVAGVLCRRSRLRKTIAA